jgi:hypothetical protein
LAKKKREKVSDTDGKILTIIIILMSISSKSTISLLTMATHKILESSKGISRAIPFQQMTRIQIKNSNFKHFNHKSDLKRTIEVIS